MGPSRWTDSPYVGICIRPRATIRAIVDRDPTDRIIALVLVAAAIVVLTQAIHGYDYNPTAFTIAGKPIPGMPPHWSQLMKLWGYAIVMLLAVPRLYINGALFRWIGAQLGGTAKVVEVRAAIGWRSVPSIIMTLASFAVGFLVPPPSQPVEPVSISSVLPVWRSMLPSMIILSPLWVWSLIVWLKCLSEVHRFSAWRALVTSLIGYFLSVIGWMVVGGVWGAVGGLALRATHDDPFRVLSLMLLAAILIVLLANALFWKYSRPHAQS
jgi:hypothetical protein